MHSPYIVKSHMHTKVKWGINNLVVMIRLIWLKKGCYRDRFPGAPVHALKNPAQLYTAAGRECSPEARTATECCLGIRRKHSRERETSGAGLAGLS